MTLSILDTGLAIIILAALWFFASRTRRLHRRLHQDDESPAAVRRQMLVIKVGLDEEFKLSSDEAPDAMTVARVVDEVVLEPGH